MIRKILKAIFFPAKVGVAYVFWVIFFSIIDFVLFIELLKFLITL